MTVDIIIGILAIAYGIFTLIQRKRKPESFAKLESMKKFYGEKTGYLVHVIFYSIIPMVLGGVMIVKHLI